MRILPGQYQVTYNEHNEDEAHKPFRIRMNKVERKAALKRPYAFAAALVERGILPERGCHCGLCQRDIDCCGRMFPSHVKVHPIKRGVKVVQHYRRNI